MFQNHIHNSRSSAPMLLNRAKRLLKDLAYDNPVLIDRASNFYDNFYDVCFFSLFKDETPINFTIGPRSYIHFVLSITISPVARNIRII